MKRIISILVLAALGAAVTVDDLVAQEVSDVQIIAVDGTSSPAVIPAGMLLYSGGNIILDGRVLSDPEMSVMFPTNIYSSASGGMRMRRIGKGLIIGGSVAGGVGLVSLVAGTVGMVATESNPYGVTGSDVAIVAGSIALVTGIVALSGGVPLFCVGQGRMRRAVNAYNRAYMRDYTVNIGPTDSGFGFSLNF